LDNDYPSIGTGFSQNLNLVMVPSWKSSKFGGEQNNYLLAQSGKYLGLSPIKNTLIQSAS
jgi:hypothetical protein